MTQLTPRDWSSHAAFISPEYKSSNLRGVSQNLVKIDPELSELTGPAFGQEVIGPLDHDLTKNGQVNGQPIGERIVLTGTVFDEVGKPVPNTLIEIWQAHDEGRYLDRVEEHESDIDPNFLGAGRCLTDEKGQYKFYTIKPGAYPWGNHPNAWRPNHIHLSLLGPCIASRIVTQMYFPGDPLLQYDPIDRKSVV